VLAAHRSRALVLALALVVALPYLRTFAAGSAVRVAGPSDFLAYGAAAATYVGDHMREEHGLPLWRTSQFFGYPLLGDPVSRILYPPYWLHAFLDVPRARNAYLLIHALALALGTFALARAERCSPRAALLASLGMGLSFKWVGNELAGWDAVLSSVSWIPLALAFLVRAARERTDRSALLAGGALALSCYAGTPQFFVSLALALPFAWLTTSRKKLRRRARVLAVAFAFGFALAAPVLLPSLEVSARSARHVLRASYGTTLGLDILGALAFPDFTRADYSWETANALGFALLPLVGAVVARSGRRVPVLARLAAIALVLAAGYRTPIGLLVERLPVIGTLSYVSRHLWIVAIALSVVAARGLDVVTRSSRKKSVTWGLAAGALLLVVGALTPGRLERVTPPGLGAGAAAAGLVFECLLALSLALLPFLARARRMSLAWGVVALTALELLLVVELASVRVPWEPLTRPSKVEEALAREPLARFAAVTSESIWFDPVLPFYCSPRLERSDGYNPLHTEAVNRFLFSIKRHEPGSADVWTPYLGLTDLAGRPGFLALGTTHLVAHETLGLEPLVSDKKEILTHAGERRTSTIHLLRVPEALPRAYFMARARQDDPEPQRTSMRRGAFDGRKTLYVDGEVPPELAGSLVEGDPPLEPVAVLEHRANRVRLHATAPRAGFVVLLDAWGPDWTATVDDVATPIRLANANFRAVQVSAGDHEIVMEIHAPREALLGAALSLGALVLAVLRSRRPSSGAPAPSRGGA
jgi:hypothetical protein